MAHVNYQQRRQQIEHYFDRTAADVWARLTSDEPVSGIRETVRAGREEMRNTLLSWLPEDLSGRQVLDAGCGTGVISIELAKRGAEVIAVDLSQSLILQPENPGVAWRLNLFSFHTELARRDSRRGRTTTISIR